MDTDSLARIVGDTLQQRHLTLAVAESCTGGLLATYITNIPGSSAYFAGGVIAYSDTVKEQLLHVPARTLQRYGAVSAQTAKAMAQAVRDLLHVDLALAVTGIAGPSGATPDQPVGLVYIALASARGVKCREYTWTGDRWQNREWSAKAALQMLHEHLLTTNESTQKAKPEMRRDSGTTSSPTVVEARFEEDGRLTPLAFHWQGQRMPVTSWGRTWVSGQGEEKLCHYLVMTVGERVFELTFQPSSLCWRVVQRRARGAMA